MFAEFPNLQQVFQAPEIYLDPVSDPSGRAFGHCQPFHGSSRYLNQWGPSIKSGKSGVELGRMNGSWEVDAGFG